MQVTVSINRYGYCERLVWEKSPMQDAYKFHIEVDNESVYSESRLKFSREFIADYIKSARRVVGEDSVTIK